jgi:hypothetical protein
MRAKKDSGTTTMNEARRKRLESKGWRFGTVKEFLGLSDEEEAFIELKLRLTKSLREVRIKKGLGQVRAAKLIHSSQSRVAKMEAGDPSVSVDLLVRSHFALGVTAPELGRIIAGR